MARSGTALAAIARELRDRKPERAHRRIYDALVVAVVAGEASPALALRESLLALPPPRRGITALSPFVLDVLGHVTGVAPLEPARLDEIGRHIRRRLTMNSFQGAVPTDDSWRDRPPPWFFIDRWRRIQRFVDPEFATEASEREALVRLDEILKSWTEDSRGIAYGTELVVAWDLAFRHNERERAIAWASQHAWRIEAEHLADEMLSLPSIAGEMIGGFFRPWCSVDTGDLAAVVEQARRLAAAGPSKPLDLDDVPRVQRREVYYSYGQIHLEPYDMTEQDLENIYFQLPLDMERGMSLFPTMVGLTVPGGWGTLHSRVEVEPEPPRLDEALRDAVQAVAFPLTVRSPLCLRSVDDDGEDDDPLGIPLGTYDVLAVFTSAEPDPETDSPCFDLRLTFCPAGSLDAPRTFRLSA